MKSLSPRQRDLLVAWRTYEREHGFAPTWRELRDLLGISSTNAVGEHISALARKGYLERGPCDTSRTTRLRKTSVVLLPRRCAECGAETYAAETRGCFVCRVGKAGVA